jgi:hypothetical protein
MKVGPTTESIRYLKSVHEKREAGDDSGHRSGQQQDQQSSEQHEQSGSDVFEVTDEKVGSAIDAFRRDTQAQARGLSAEMMGKGPGLRVTLKDGSGAIVRQFTGEEFLKLREATAGRASGKILDQKI